MVPIYFSIIVVVFSSRSKGLTKQRSSIAITPRHFGATVPFRSSKRLERGDWGQAAKKLYENTNPNVVDYKGLVRPVTSGATTTIHGVGRKLR